MKFRFNKDEVLNAINVLILFCRDNEGHDDLEHELIDLEDDVSQEAA